LTIKSGRATRQRGRHSSGRGFSGGIFLGTRAGFGGPDRGQGRGYRLGSPPGTSWPGGPRSAGSP